MNVFSYLEEIDIHDQVIPRLITTWNFGMEPIQTGVGIAISPTSYLIGMADAFHLDGDREGAAEAIFLMRIMFTRIQEVAGESEH